MPTIAELSRDLYDTEVQIGKHTQDMNLLNMMRMLKGHPPSALLLHLSHIAPQIVTQLKTLEKTQNMTTGLALVEIAEKILPKQIADLSQHKEQLLAQIFKSNNKNEQAPASQSQSSEKEVQTKYSETQEKTSNKPMDMKKNHFTALFIEVIESDDNNAVTIIDDDPRKDDSGDKYKRDVDDGDNSGEHEDHSSGGHSGSSDGIDGNDDGPAAPLSETAEETESDIHTTALDLTSSTNSSANYPQGIQTDLETNEKESDISLVGFAVHDTEHPI